MSVIDFSCFFQKRGKEYKKWSDAEDEIKFKRFKLRPDSYTFGLQLFNSNPPQYIGFNASGKALPPSHVKTSKSDAWLFYKPIR